MPQSHSARKNLVMGIKHRTRSEDVKRCADHKERHKTSVVIEDAVIWGLSDLLEERRQRLHQELDQKLQNPIGDTGRGPRCRP